MGSRRALIDQCFDEFEKGRWSFITPHFMKKAQEEFILALEIVRKYLRDPEAFKKLKVFIDDLEFGHWTTAKIGFPPAKQEYIKFLKVIEEIKTPKSDDKSLGKSAGGVTNTVSDNRNGQSDDKSLGKSVGGVTNTISDNRNGNNVRPRSYQPPSLEGFKDRDSTIRPYSYRFPAKNYSDDPLNQFQSDKSIDEPSFHHNSPRRVRVGKLGESRLGRPGLEEPYEEEAEKYQAKRLETYRDSGREGHPRVEDAYRKTQSEGLDRYRENLSTDVGQNKVDIPKDLDILGISRPNTYRKSQNEGSEMTKEVLSHGLAPGSRNHSHGSDKSKSEQIFHSRKLPEQVKLNTARDEANVDSTGDQTKELNIDIRDNRGKYSTVRQDDDSNGALDDYNRVVRLAERFTDLYNNEYVQAFNELRRHRYFERDAVFYLLRFVKQAYDFCLLQRDKMLDEEVNSLDFQSRAALRNRQFDERFKRHLLDRRNRAAQFILSRVLKEYFEFAYERLLPHYPLDEIARMKIRRYAERCVEIVWGLCTQEPPVCMKWPSDRKQGETVDIMNLEFYQPYTKPEKYVDYCVWPVLLLHENGPILKKGIVQGISI